MSNKNLDITVIKEGLTEWDNRYAIINTDTGEIVDDCNGYGYTSPKKAWRAYWYKNRNEEEKKKIYESEKKFIERFNTKQFGIFNEFYDIIKNVYGTLTYEQLETIFILSIKDPIEKIKSKNIIKQMYDLLITRKGKPRYSELFEKSDNFELSEKHK